jgi:hypothetical protein
MKEALEMATSPEKKNISHTVGEFNGKVLTSGTNSNADITGGKRLEKPVNTLPKHRRKTTYRCVIYSITDHSYNATIVHPFPTKHSAPLWQLAFHTDALEPPDFFSLSKENISFIGNDDKRKTPILFRAVECQL